MNAARRNVNMIPKTVVEMLNVTRIPRNCGVAISQMYVRPGASLNPTLTPIRIEDAYNISALSAVYNRNQAIVVDIFMSKSPCFRPM